MACSSYVPLVFEAFHREDPGVVAAGGGCGLCEWPWFLAGCLQRSLNGPFVMNTWCSDKGASGLYWWDLNISRRSSIFQTKLCVGGRSLLNHAETNKQFAFCYSCAAVNVTLQAAPGCSSRPCGLHWCVLLLFISAFPGKTSTRFNVTACETSTDEAIISQCTVIEVNMNVSHILYCFCSLYQATHINSKYVWATFKQRVTIQKVLV